MQIAVIGAGGIGSVFGGRLAAAGHAVWLVHRRAEVVEALTRSGLHLEALGTDDRVSVKATTDTCQIGPADLVLVTTKATDTQSAAVAAKPLIAPQTLVVTLQNGLGNLETLADVLGAERCLVGMTYLGAASPAPGRVRLTAPGQTFVGEPDGAISDRVQFIAQTFSDAGLPTQATDRLWQLVWGKLVINAALNATCALTGGGGTDMLRSDAAQRWLSLVAEETAAVAAAEGIALPYPDATARVLQHCRDVGSAKPSMLQDVERGRPTEIDAINGAVVRAGNRLGVPVPYNLALLHLVKGLEQVRGFA